MDLWKDIPEFENLYQANTNGEIKSLNHLRKNSKGEYENKGKLLKFNKNNSGYFQVRLSKNGIAKTYRVNRLIAITFIDNPLNKETVYHVNGNKTDNIVENLKWATRKEQTKHMHEILGVPYADCSNLVKRRWNNGTMGA